MSRARYCDPDLAVAAGVNHLDAAHSYGHAEVVMNPWLAEHRSEVFLATKTRGEVASSRAGLEDSLRRLGSTRSTLFSAQLGGRR